jgi:uncharacterized protein YndB with AHSA1/START domain
LLDAEDVQQWMVPEGMTSQIDSFDAREGGEFRISLTYDMPTAVGAARLRRRPSLAPRSIDQTMVAR